MTHKYAKKAIQKFYTKRKFYKINLDDLQEYFNCHVFYFDEDYDHEDYNEALGRKYEEQALIFLRNLGAMLSVEAFLTIGNDEVYVRKLPPGMTSIREEL
jgi:hypothetical protein